METILAWHFTGSTLRDGRPIPPIGEWLVHEGPLEPCVKGLHASTEPWDALQFAPGEFLHRVELSGETLEHGNPVDKLVARKRRIVASFDATQLLRRFAADQALSVSDLWNMSPIVREYLETLDESKRDAARAAARDAAWAAARDAAWDAARAAARDAARAAARAAAWAAARDAAWAAARDAARDAAWAAARDAARAAARAAAWDAAWDAARDAAGAAARKEFNQRVFTAFGVSQ